MADVAVDFALKLLGVVLNEIKLLGEVHGDVEWLHTELKRMRSFLLDAERRSLSGEEAVQNWVREITDAAYEAEDIAAKFVARNRGRGVRAILQRYTIKLNELHDIGNDIKRLKEKMVEIGQSRERYGITNSSSSSSGGGGSCSNNTVHELRRRPLYQNEEDVVGLEKDKERVMELLHGEESGRYVIGVVGMGGMGKTTLARQVFKRSRFPKSAWLDLSQNYIENHRDAIHRLLINLAKQVVPDSSDLERKETTELSDLVKASLKDERYLIVMDDMWETDVWDFIKDHLPDVKNGSRIIITTRNANVAEHPALHFSPHRMEGLDERRSWDLFTRLVFEDEEQMRRDCTGPLKKLAEELVGGCGGSPLALTVLGGLLAGKEKTCYAWRDVVGSKKWMREEAGKNCMETLKLSYMDLPHHLKLCFRYLSAFPEDHHISVEKLIRLWVAEGFVVEPESHQEKTPEDIAKTYLVDLQQRCLLRVHWGYEYHYPHSFITEYCRIHDMIRELSIDEAKKVNFMNFMDEAAKDRRENGAMHRLSLQGKFFSFSGVVDGASLRTLLNFTKIQPIAFKRLCLLRVLDLEGAKISKLPEEVGDMVLLRYLSIKGTDCRSLPRSVSRLSYLETLDCRTYNFDLVIPNKVWKMETLKHVYGKSRLDKVDVSYIVKLQTLDYVMWASVSSFIHHMTNLQELSIRGKGFLGGNQQSLPSSSWEALQSLPSLKFLSLCNLSMADLVNTTTGFPNLQRLTISSCKIKSWEVQEESMPSLEILFLYFCYGLKRLPRGLAYCTKLLRIYCHGMLPEFLQWYDTSKEDAAWEFRGLAQYMSVLGGWS